MYYEKPNGASIEEIKEYMSFRGQKYPNSKAAFDFAITEMGELFECLKDKQSSKIQIRSEFGDLYQMLQISSVEATGKHLEDISEEAEEFAEGLKLSDLVIYMSKLMDSFLRRESGWVRNNPDKKDTMEFNFSVVYNILFRMSVQYTAVCPCTNMLEKWELKGYVNNAEV